MGLRKRKFISNKIYTEWVGIIFMCFTMDYYTDKNSRMITNYYEYNGSWIDVYWERKLNKRTAILEGCFNG